MGSRPPTRPAEHRSRAGVWARWEVSEGSLGAQEVLRMDMLLRAPLPGTLMVLSWDRPLQFGHQGCVEAVPCGCSTQPPAWAPQPTHTWPVPQGTPGFRDSMVTSEGLLYPHPPLSGSQSQDSNLLKGHVTWKSVELLLKTQTENATTKPLECSSNTWWCPHVPRTSVLGPPSIHFSQHNRKWHLKWGQVSTLMKTCSVHV